MDSPDLLGYSHQVQSHSSNVTSVQNPKARAIIFSLLSFFAYSPKKKKTQKKSTKSETGRVSKISESLIHRLGLDGKDRRYLAGWGKGPDCGHT